MKIIQIISTFIGVIIGVIIGHLIVMALGW